VRQARERRVIRIVGTGENRWPFVHVDDLADLYVLALSAAGGSLYFASAGPSIPVKEVALAAAHGATVESIPIEQARRALGPVADALVLDQIISSRKAVRELGWSPKRQPVIEELR
jgi:nucleoside-diphosphate-sugar epimerase